ncbi:MAG: 4'-phosphopantetheinyl transferase family protein [Anaerovoracaceae bacterium]|jgi:4'-phosphopantetheinyl transferase
MDIYIYEGYAGNRKRPDSQDLIRAAAGDPGAVIDRNENGKPYFTDLPLEFSISHSGQLWICAIADEPVGIDIQEVKVTDYMKLAGRFYTEAEQDFCRKYGRRGFFRIWVRKEALVKYSGTTLGRGLSRIETVRGGELLDLIKLDRKEISLKEIEMSPDIFCVVAAEDTEGICIKSLN